MKKLTQAIFDHVCEEYGVTMAELKSSRRSFKISHPRQYLMCLLMNAGLSTPLIGALLGGKDHTTVLHAQKSVKKREPILFDAIPVTLDRIAESVGHDRADVSVEIFCDTAKKLVLEMQKTDTLSSRCEALEAENKELRQRVTGLSPAREKNLMNRSYRMFAVQNALEDEREQVRWLEGELNRAKAKIRSLEARRIAA